MDATIFDYIKKAETSYTLPVTVTDRYEWGMRDHIHKSVIYKNGQLLRGKDENTPIKNIVRPILNLRYRSEGFDVKDINIYVEEENAEHLSFLLKKAHDEFARENDLDGFIDDLVTSNVDFGGMLVKDVNANAPEVVQLQSIAFCDQSNILSGPIGIRHMYSPSELLMMADFGWGNAANNATATLEDVVTLAQMGDLSSASSRATGAVTQGDGVGNKKSNDGYIEVYEVFGAFPDDFIPGGMPMKYTNQLHICVFYEDENKNKQGLTLFAARRKESPFFFETTDPVFGRALGVGGVEELEEAQVWTTYGKIREREMLDGAALNIFETDDSTQYGQPTLSNMQNNTVLLKQEGKAGLRKVDTYPTNIRLFNESVNEWEAHAKTTAAAQDAIQGISPTAGTPFALQDLVTAEAHSLHDHRSGIIASFLGDKLYPKLIIPRLIKNIKGGGKRFLSTLSFDELQWVATRIAENMAEDKMKTMLLYEGKLITEDLKNEYIDKYKKEMMDKGPSQMIELIGNEFDGKVVNVRISISKKQRDLRAMTERLSNIFTQVARNPQLLQNKGLAKIFNQILEYSGMDPVDFSSLTAEQPSAQPDIADLSTTAQSPAATQDVAATV